MVRAERGISVERLTYDFCLNGTHCNQVKGADNLMCDEVCRKISSRGCESCPISAAFDRLAAIENILGDDYDLDRLRELVEADRDGRCVVLPIPLHRMLFDVSDPYRPEVLKDFRISATWTHNGIVFHSPWNIFLQNVEKGYIRLIRKSAEAALKGDLHG